MIFNCVYITVYLLIFLMNSVFFLIFFYLKLQFNLNYRNEKEIKHKLHTKTVKESMYRQQFGTDPNLSHTP